MEQFLAINGHNLYIETDGPDSGTSVLFLHHGLGAIRSWKEQIPVFTQAGYRVAVYDRWGHGKSDSRERWAMPYFEEDLVDLQVILDHFKIDRVVLVGHSDGGKIAMYYAIRNPRRVIAMVIVSAHIYIEKKMFPGIESVRQDFQHDHRFREKMKRVHGEKSEALFWGWYNGWTREEISEWDMRPGIHRISCPTLIMQGMEDEHASPQHAQDIAAAIDDAELFLVKDATHMLPQDYPEVFNSQVQRFLEKSLPAAAHVFE